MRQPDEMCPECRGLPEPVLVTLAAMAVRCTECGHRWLEARSQAAPGPTPGYLPRHASRPPSRPSIAAVAPPPHPALPSIDAAEQAPRTRWDMYVPADGGAPTVRP